MGKAFLLSRRDLTSRLARMAQYIAGAGAVTVSITWVDEDATQGNAVCHVSTAYGETSTGRPIGSLGDELPGQIATAHLTETQKIIEEQVQSIVRAMAAAAVAKAEEAARPEEESEENDPMVAAAVEAVAELAEPHEEANADAHE